MIDHQQQTMGGTRRVARAARRWAAVGGSLVLLAAAWGQAGTGRITGRVFNPATGEYVRNAEVRLAGTNQVVATEGDGSFAFEGVAPGQATIEVTFTGYRPTTQTLTVAAGQTATRELNLVSTLDGATAAAGATVRLQQFVVSSEREGNAKAIMEQRRSMNIATSVASDVFGDVAEGNVGEFLKYLPGVELDYVEGVARGPRLGGLDAQYTSLTIDGANLASADAFTAFGDQSRSVSFEQMSINSVESIEISRTASADMDANSPGGRVNLKTKRAFDLKGRRITWQLSAAANSEEFTASKTYGPQHRRTHHIRPNYILSYSDTFLNQRLGLAFNVSSSEQYSEQYRVAMNYNTTPTAADPRPMVLQQITFKDGPRQVETWSGSVTADFRATRELVLSLTAMFNAYLNNADARLVQFNTSTNNTVAATGRTTVRGDGLTDVTTSDGATPNTAHTVGLPGSGAQKLTNTVTLLPGFEFKRGRLTVEGKGTYSKSKNDYENIVRGIARSATVNTINANFRATRPDADSHEWTITQLSGPDWSDLANYTNPRITEEGRYALTEIYSGQLDATYLLPVRRPTFLKFGGKFKEENRAVQNRTVLYNWSYIGPGGNALTGINPATGAPILTATGSWAAYRSPHGFDMGTTNGLTVRNMPPVVDLNSLANLIQQRPDQFVNIATAADYYTGRIANDRDMSETIDAGYGMANTRLGAWQFQGGVRWERTVTESKEVNPLPGSAVRAAGYAVDASGRATTIEGLNHQFLSRPKVTRRGEYDHFFPSVSAKYNLRPNLIAQAGYSYTISRPPLTAISGTWVINETQQLISAPNPELKPELSDNVMARLAWYFEPVGSLSVTLSQNEISNFRQTRRVPATAAGFVDDPTYADYEFSAPFNVEGMRRFRSMEIAYNQALSFLPGPIRGLNVNTSYTRTYANERRAGTSPHRVTGSLGYAAGRYTFRLGAVWADDAPWTATVTRWRRQYTTVDFSAGVRLTKRISFFVQGRRIFNDALRIFEGVTHAQDRPVLQQYENYGANWVFGFKGTL